jgi:uncharacterized protein (DUF305 family)
MHLKLTYTRSMAAMVAALAAGALAACGASEPPTSSPPADRSSAATAEDRTFVEDMTPHHESAVDMAGIARKRAEHAEIKTLAANIAASQQAEIGEMAQIAKAIGAKPGGPSPMHMSEDDMKRMRAGKPFDRIFIDMMIPHHQDAIRMARTTLEKGKDPDVRGLAERVIAAQSKEIEDMNEWRTQWYGKPSPAGGVPSAGSSDAPGDGGQDMHDT